MFASLTTADGINGLLLGVCFFLIFKIIKPILKYSFIFINEIYFDLVFKLCVIPEFYSAVGEVLVGTTPENRVPINRLSQLHEARWCQTAEIIVKVKELENALSQIALLRAEIEALEKRVTVLDDPTRS